MSNLDRMRKDLDRLGSEGDRMMLRMVFDLFPEEIAKPTKLTKKELEEKLPRFEKNLSTMVFGSSRHAFGAFTRPRC